MNTIQETFDLVIAEGYYARGVNGFMCTALKDAMNAGLITKDDCFRASIAVRDYIQGHTTLFNFLYTKGYKCEFKDRLSIYENWARRPMQQ